MLADLLVLISGASTDPDFLLHYISIGLEFGYGRLSTLV
jgi:hypothetical protein